MFGRNKLWLQKYPKCVCATHLFEWQKTKIPQIHCYYSINKRTKKNEKKIGGLLINHNHLNGWMVVILGNFMDLMCMALPDWLAHFSRYRSHIRAKFVYDVWFLNIKRGQTFFFVLASLYRLSLHVNWHVWVQSVCVCTCFVILSLNARKFTNFATTMTLLVFDCFFVCIYFIIGNFIFILFIFIKSCFLTVFHTLSVSIGWLL